MKNKPYIFSGYKNVWLFVMFDLPVNTPKKRKIYSNFRNNLLKLGFTMLQYSIYAKFFPSMDASKSSISAIKTMLPPEGEVRLLFVTDKQFGKMEVFYGKTPKQPERPPPQMLLF